MQFTVVSEAKIDVYNLFRTTVYNNTIERDVESYFFNTLNISIPDWTCQSMTLCFFFLAT